MKQLSSDGGPSMRQCSVQSEMCSSKGRELMGCRMREKYSVSINWLLIVAKPYLIYSQEFALCGVLV
jgi:hypothetical protein